MNNKLGNNDISQYLLGISLLQFESVCYYHLTKYLIDFFKMDVPPPKYGCTAGRNSFSAMGFQLDASVFLYESLKHLSIFSDEVRDTIDQSHYADLEVVRNNIHTYFKNGGFAEKANTIIEEKLKEYKLNSPDILYFLRNDISLIFHITNNSRHLIGCDYFTFHCIYESENKNWIGTDYRDYGEFISSGIKDLAQSVDETPYQLSQLEIVERLPVVELFDYKSADLMSGSKVSDASTFRLLLMLYNISYILLLVNEIFDYSTINKNDLWTCFFNKLLAIKYDESFDNLQSLLTFSSKEDKELLGRYCKNENLIIENLDARKFAQSLRNTIHYQELCLDTNKNSIRSTKDMIVALYLSNTDLKSMSELRNKGKIMINEMKQLQKVIRKIISVDKSYTK